MEISYVHQPAMRLTGISVRTSNASEATPDGKIPELWNQFFAKGISQQVAGIRNPNLTYGLYTDYESDVNGMYTLLLGHEVSVDEPQKGLQSAVLPASRYVVFRTEQGAMPQEVIEAWQKIWAWLEHTTDIRTYTGDFEVYDSKYSPTNAIVEIYIAIA